LPDKISSPIMMMPNAIIVSIKINE